jgi:hypothetical protein
MDWGFLICGVVVCLISIRRSRSQWASAKGDKEKIAKVRGRIIWSLVGLVGVFVTHFILSVIVNFFGVDPL